MATALAQISIEMRDLKINNETFPNRLVLSHSEEIPKPILSIFEERGFIFGRFLSIMGSKKITFQATLNNLNPSTIYKVCEAMSYLGEARKMKEVTAQMLSEEDPQSWMIEHAQQSADQAEAKYKEAEEAYKKACALAQIQINF